MLRFLVMLLVVIVVIVVVDVAIAIATVVELIRRCCFRRSNAKTFAFVFGATCRSIDGELANVDGATPNYLEPLIQCMQRAFAHTFAHQWQRCEHVAAKLELSEARRRSQRALEIDDRAQRFKVLAVTRVAIRSIDEQPELLAAAKHRAEQLDITQLTLVLHELLGLLHELGAAGLQLFVDLDNLVAQRHRIGTHIEQLVDRANERLIVIVARRANLFRSLVAKRHQRRNRLLLLVRFNDGTNSTRQL